MIRLLSIIANLIVLLRKEASQPSIDGDKKHNSHCDHQNVPASQECKGALVDAFIAHQSTHDKEWQNEQKGYWKRQIRISKGLNWITGIGTAIALVALWFIYRQADMARIAAQATVDQVAIMDKSLHTTERAWVTVKGITIEDLMIAGKEPIAVAGIHNSGHSPALQLTIHHFHQIVPSLTPKDKPAVGRIAGESLAVVGPDSKMTSRQAYLSVTMEEMSNLAAGKAHLYSYGIIQYMDIFGIDHWTMFCYRSRDLSDRNLVACSELNEVDKN